MAGGNHNEEVVSSQGECTDCGTSASSESSFDELARGLATGTITRGRALRMLGGALVGASLASIPAAAWAACKQPFRKCTANTQCCSRRCIKNPQGSGKICGCPTGQTLCPAGNQCVTCTHTGEVVNLTTCKCECPTDTELCNNACVSNVCSGGRVFNQATCKCECLTGQEVCSGTNTCVPSCDPTTGEVLVFDADTGNCRCECPTDTEMCGGACVSACTPPKTQRNPQSCACECPTGTQTCGSNCCAAGTECCGGECRPLCATGEQRNPNTCQCESQVVCTQGCGAPAGYPQCAPPDASGFSCRCFELAEGACGCGRDAFCRGLGTCNSSAQCPVGMICIVNTGCGSGGVCVAACAGAVAQISTTQALSTPQSRRSGPTAAGR